VIIYYNLSSLLNIITYLRIDFVRVTFQEWL